MIKLLMSIDWERERLNTLLLSPPRNPPEPFELFSLDCEDMSDSMDVWVRAYK